MDRFNALGRGMQLMLVAGVLLLIDTFLDWQSIDTAIGSFGQSAWHGFGGVLLGLLVIVLLAWLAVRLAAAEIQLPVSASLIAAFLGFLIFIVAVLKNLIDDYSSFWSYVGIVLAALIAVGAWLQVQETGGVDALRSDLPGMPGSTGTTTTSASTTTTSEPAAAPPPPPAAPSEPPVSEEPPAAPPEPQYPGKSTEEPR
jgi:hypothetical protein